MKRKIEAIVWVGFLTSWGLLQKEKRPEESKNNVGMDPGLVAKGLFTYK